MKFHLLFAHPVCDTSHLFVQNLDMGIIQWAASFDGSPVEGYNAKSPEYF